MSVATEFWTPERDIILLRAIAEYKPIGPQRHFAMMFIVDLFNRLMPLASPATPTAGITSDDIWARLKTWYNLPTIELVEAEQVVMFVENDEVVAFELGGTGLEEVDRKGKPLFVDFDLPRYLLEGHSGLEDGMEGHEPAEDMQDDS